LGYLKPGRKFNLVIIPGIGGQVGIRPGKGFNRIGFWGQFLKKLKLGYKFYD